MSLGYSFVDGAFEGQAIQLETTQMRIPKSDLKTAIFYAKPNDGDTFYHIVLSKGENYIEGKSTISVAVFGMGGKEEVVPEWISDVAVMDEYAILFNPGYTIDELVLTSEAPTNDQVKYWHESRVPFYDQAELNHHFSLIEQTQDEIRSFVSWREVVEGTLGDYESRISHLVWFSNENQSFITNAEGAVTSQTVVTSEIVTYSGRNRVAGTINSVVLRDSSGSTMSGGSITYSNPTASNSGSVTWTIPSGTNLLKDSGFLDVTITVEDVSYSKKLYWNKAKTGQKGADGATGVGIDSVVEYYLATSASSGVTTDTSGWSTTIQTITPDKKYLWNYETVNYTDETSKNTTPVIIGVYGDKGRDGSDGSPGRGIGAITNYYLASDSSSGVTREVGDWTTSVQNVTASKRYLWNYEKIDYVNPTGVDYTQPAIIGVYGDKGEKGDPGIQGPKGADGESTYFHVRYSQAANGNPMTPVATDAKYMGTVVTTSPTGPTEYAEYTWVLIKGLDGTNGTPGPKGADGKTSYLHIKYSDDGTTFTANNGETPGKWIGQYVDFIEADSTTFNHYTWTKVEGPKGADGANASLLYLSADSQVIKVSKSGDNNPTSVLLTANRQNATGTVNFTTSPTVTLTGSGDVRTLTAASMGNNERVVVTATLGVLTDKITIVKIADGTDGSTGKDAFTVFLTNETHTFPASVAGVVDSGDMSAGSSQVRVYSGTTQLTCPDVTTSAPTTNNTYKVISVVNSTGLTLGAPTLVGGQYQVNPTSFATTNDTATVTLTIVGRVDGVNTTFTKTIAYSKSKTGIKGDKGIDAKLVDISSSHNFFIGEDIDKVRVYTPSAIILTPNFQNCAYNKWQYSINGTTFSDVTSGSNGLSINETTKALSIASTSSLYSPTQLSITFKCLSATGEFDLITISRIYDSESLITRVIDTETEIIQTNEQINSKVRKSLLTTAITTITEDLSGRVTSIQITPLKTTLSEGTRVVIVDSDSINSYVATVSREVLVGSTILPLDAVTLTAKKQSTVHIEQAYQTSQIKQTADSILQEVSKYNSNKAQVTPGGATLYRFNKDLKSTDGKSEAVIF